MNRPIIRRTHFLFLCLLLLFACSDDEVKTTVVIEQNSFSFSKEGGSSTLKIEANVPVEVVSSEPTWCVVSPLEAAAPLYQYRITVSSNPLYEKRAARIVVFATGFEQQLAVEQEAGSMDKPEQQP